jgi:hypothetical protein
MNTLHPPLATPPPDYEAMMAAAKACAPRLREQAIDALWHEAGAASRRSLRAMTRLARALVRHTRQRRSLEG